MVTADGAERLDEGEPGADGRRLILRVIQPGPDRESRAMEGFDLDRYLRASKRVDLSGVAWDRVERHALSETEARCLAYMMDIESHTSVYLRDLLATSAAFDPDVTAFLSLLGLRGAVADGEAFSRFLGEAGWKLAPISNASRPTRPTPRACRGTSGSGAGSAGVASSATSGRCSDRRSWRTSSPCT